VIVGIDTNSSGFHAVELGHALPVLHTYQGEERTASERRPGIYHAFRKYFASLESGAWVFVEEALVLKTNTETTRKLVMVAGLLEAAMFEVEPDAFLAWVDVTVWRRKVLGRGGGPTAVMKRMARDKSLEFGLPMCDDDPDFYDACCIALYGRAVRST